MSPTIRTLLTSFLIAAVAPIGLATLDLEQPAFAKNGNGGGTGGGNGGGKGGGNGGGHGGGNGGGNGGGQDNGNGNGQAQGHAKKADTGAQADDDGESDGLSAKELGKLNGVLHASPTAIEHASTNSPIGTAREFGEALSDFLDQDTTEGEGDEAAEGESDSVTTDDLAGMMANMTNKPVTAEQVEAVAGKLGIETVDEETDGDDSDDQASDDPSDSEAPKLDHETAQEIADKTNEIHGFTDDTSDDDGDDTADAGDTDDTGDETATN